jgi:hypothetical protein
MNIKRYIAVCVLAGFLCSCFQEPERLSVGTSPRILRGIWTGNYWTRPDPFQEPVKGEAVKLVAEATYLDEDNYKVTGTFQIGTQEPLAIAGTMDGSSYQIYTQASPPVRFSSPLKDAAGKEVGEFYVFLPLGSRDALYEGWISNSESNDGNFSIRRQQ